MNGKLDLSPWARAAIPDQAALRARVPDGHKLTVVTRDRRRFTVRLTTPSGMVAESHGLPIEEAIEAVFAAANDDILFAGTIGEFLDAVERL